MKKVLLECLSVFWGLAPRFFVFLGGGIWKLRACVSRLYEGGFISRMIANLFSILIREYWESYGSEYQVSPWAQNDYGGVSISASIPITSSYSHTGSIGANGVAVIIGKIIDLGYEFNYSSSSQTGVTISFAIPLGKRGCIYFTPIFMNYDSC